MSISISKHLMRWLSPKADAQRMQVRRMRCIAEANAEDLVRTISASHGQIKAMVDEERSNGKGEH